MRAKLPITSGIQFVACGQSNQRPLYEAANRSDTLDRPAGLEEAPKASAESHGSATRNRKGRLPLGNRP